MMNYVRLMNVPQAFHCDFSGWLYSILSLSYLILSDPQLHAVWLVWLLVHSFLSCLIISSSRDNLASKQRQDDLVFASSASHTCRHYSGLF